MKAGVVESLGNIIAKELPEPVLQRYDCRGSDDLRHEDLMKASPMCIVYTQNGGAY